MPDHHIALIALKWRKGWIAAFLPCGTGDSKHWGSQRILLCRFAFACTSRSRLQSGDPLRYGRRSAVSSLRSGDPQLCGLARL